MSFAWLDPEETRRALAYLEEAFGIPAGVFAEHRLQRRGEYIHAVHREVAPAAQVLSCSAAGLRLLRQTHSGGFRPATRGLQVFGREATRAVCDVDGAALRALVEGRSLPWQGEGRGPVLLRWAGHVVGLGVLRDGSLVGQVPRSMTESLQLRPGGDVI